MLVDTGKDRTVLRSIAAETDEIVVRVADIIGKGDADAPRDRLAACDEIAGLEDRIGGICSDLRDRCALGLHEIACLSYIRHFGIDPQYYGLFFGVNIIGVASVSCFNRMFVTRCCTLFSLAARGWTDGYARSVGDRHSHVLGI